MLIVKIKKNFEKINFSDNILTGTVHCAPLQSEFLIFFSKFQNINLWKVSKKSEGPQGMLILLSKSENRGILVIPCALCVDQKYFGKLTLSLKVFNGASLKKIGDFELPRYFVAYKYSLLNEKMILTCKVNGISNQKPNSFHAFYRYLIREVNLKHLSWIVIIHLEKLILS